MKNPFVKVGAIGGIITAICCFTPVLVWVFGAVGLSVAVAYLDTVLFPLLGIFSLMLGYGLYRWWACHHKKPSQFTSRDMQ